MEGANDTWRPLGELFVERGLITDDELAGALEEQERSGRRLGTILISRGIVSEPELTSALVEQIGIDGLLDELELAAAEVDAGRSEQSGRFPKRRRATAQDDREDSGNELTDSDDRQNGWAFSVAAPPAPDEDESRKTGGRGPFTWLASGRHALDDAEAEVARLSAEVAETARALNAERERAVERESVLQREIELRTQAEQEIDRLHAEVASRDEAIEKLEARVADLADRIAEAAEALAAERVARECAEQAEARLAADLDAHEVEAGRLSRQLNGLIGNVQALGAEHERALQSLRAREQQVAELENLVQRLESRASTDADVRVSTPAPEQALTLQNAGETFLVIVPRPDESHELVERAGQPPVVGDELQLGERRFTVERIGRSPLPFDRRACVQLRDLL